MKKKFNERLNAILPEITNDNFLCKRNVAGEIPFYIFDYPPNKELKMREHIDFMINYIKGHHNQINLAHIKLFDLMIEYINKRGILEKSFQLEVEKGPSALWKALSATVDPERFVKIINEKYPLLDINLILISGVGTIWPWVHAHSLLNNLQSITKDISVVMFYPGKYNGQLVSLFDKLPGDNYYRAFSLLTE